MAEIRDGLSEMLGHCYRKVLVVVAAYVFLYTSLLYLFIIMFLIYIKSGKNSTDIFMMIVFLLCNEIDVFLLLTILK